MLRFKKLIKWFYPKYFVSGIFIGFLLCCIAGFIVSKSARFSHFNRFFRIIQPESHFYPTISELIATVRHEMDTNKILILVGGSSIMRGVGQNPGELWTKQLQMFLGDRFKVVNFAANGAGASSFAGVAFRVLVEEYNKIIYVSDCPSFGQGSVDGVNPYTYIFWDAYYKNLFHPDKAEKKIIAQIKKNEIKDQKEGLELHLMSYLDSIFYFKDFWNWVSYRLVFTVWNNFSYATPFKPRLRYIEDVLDLKKIKIQNENARFQEEVDHINNTVDGLVDLSKNPPQYREDVLIRVRTSFDEGFTLRYRSKILCIIPSDNPKHLSHISTKLQQASKYVNQQMRDLLTALNYHAIEIGQDFLPEDFYDGRHLSASGGNKVAKKVAKEVENIAAINGYEDI